jgi:hypothetical protein
VKALGVDAGAAAGFAIATHMFNILWITIAGLASMVALKLTFADVFSLGTPREPPPVEASPLPAVEAGSP